MSEKVKFTTARVKQAIFNIIGEKIKGAKFLELFAGSGAVGQEGLKRGAESVVFVDIDTSKLITHNSQLITILQMDALCAIRRFGKQGEQFDIIFLDPPYYGDTAKKTLKVIAQYDILFKIGIIIVEHYKKDVLPEAIDSLRLFKQKKYGDSYLSLYHKLKE